MALDRHRWPGSPTGRPLLPRVPDTLVRVVEPDWTQMRESEAWPVRIEAAFVDSYGTTDMNDFAEWLNQLDAPGPTRLLTHFRDRVMTFAFPVDADPAAIRWWVEMAQLQPDAFATVLVIADTE